jgi:hypothetical protein
MSPALTFLQRMAAGASREPARWGCVLLCVAWVVLRFVGLTSSPPGFALDEALGALHLQCLAETGRTALGRPWPLFEKGFNGGFYTPAFLYSGVAWVELFGSSIASMRALAAMYSSLTVLGLWLLARQLLDRRGAELTALAAALSPWAFQFSRIAWDPPLAPAFLVWGVYAFFRDGRAGARVASGVLLSLAMYSYPPLRAQVPLVLLLLLVCGRERPRGMLALCAAFAIASMPLVIASTHPSFTSRTARLSIVNRSYIESERGQRSPPLFVAEQLLRHFAEHLRPSFLFTSGDASLRHSSQLIGELGFLDDAAIVLALWLLLARRRPREGQVTRYPLARVALGAAWVAFCGVLPAALTNEGLPHALRAIGAWPALSLLTGLTLSLACQRLRLMPWLVVALAAAQTLYFIPRYFTDYPPRAADIFRVDLQRAADAHDPSRLMAAGRNSDVYQLRYYLIEAFGQHCGDSAALAKRIHDGSFLP